MYPDDLGSSPWPLRFLLKFQIYNRKKTIICLLYNKKNNTSLNWSFLIIKIILACVQSTRSHPTTMRICPCQKVKKISWHQYLQKLCLKSITMVIIITFDENYTNVTASFPGVWRAKQTLDDHKTKSINATYKLLCISE